MSATCVVPPTALARTPACPASLPCLPVPPGLSARTGQRGRAGRAVPRRVWRLCLVVLLALTAAWAMPGLPRSAPGAQPVAAAAPQSGALPLSFVPNRGQTDPSVRFQAHGAGGTLFFTSHQVVLSMPIDSQGPGERGEAVVAVSFEGANSAPELTGAEPLPGVVNYFIGDDAARWRTNLPTYRGLVYEDLYPGIDLHYSGAGRADDRSFVLKGTYVVAPGADPGRIHWRYTGSTGIHVDEASGDLHIGSRLVERAPLAWQVIAGRREAVGARYVVGADGSLGFSLGGYDPSYPLILDPTLTYSTYLGGRGTDRARAIALDAEGNIYVAGQTNSPDFPSVNPAQPNLGGGGFGDAFIVKLNPSGSAVLYATYLGGASDDIALDVAVDGQGNAYLAGDTQSFNFPTHNAAQPDFGGDGGDAFIVKLGPTGSQLVYATFLGGSVDEWSNGIAVDGAGRVYVTGYTNSTDFPIVRAVQPEPSFDESHDPPGDAFVTQVISVTGVYTWGFSTFLGGTGLDMGRGIALDAAGTVYVTGHTHSPNFPTAHAAQPVYGGGSSFGRGDAFITHIVQSSGVYTWGFSTFLGGSGDEDGYALAVDESGDVYVTGETDSTDFLTLNPFQPAIAGGRDAFATRLVSSSGVGTWSYSTYLGGSGNDRGQAIALDGAGHAFLVGLTRSSDFPATLGAYDPQCGTDGLCNNGSYDDAWLAELNADGSALSYATYLGGSRGDAAFDVALGAGGEIYLVGDTNSSNFPTSGAYDSSCGSDGTCNGDFAPDAFMVKLSEARAVYLPILMKDPGAVTPPPGCAPYLIATIGVGDTPRGIALDTSRNRAYVANYEGGSVSVIDINRHAVITTVTGITAANGIAYDAQHNRIWVSNTTSDQVTPIEANEDATSFTPLPPVDVGDGPWGVAYDGLHDSVYVVNNLDDSMTVVDAETRAVTATLRSSFRQPFHAAANPLTGKVYVSNFGDHSLAVIAGGAVSRVALNAGDPSTQPYGLAVDETRGLVYVATVNSHRVVVIGSDPAGTPDRVLGWVALQRGFGDPERPVPLRVIAVNPDIGPAGDGGHLWATTSTGDGSEANQALLIPKGWPGFHSPVPYSLSASPSEGIAVDRLHNWVYLSSGTAQGTVTVLGDSAQSCMIPFTAGGGIEFETFDVR